MKGCVDNNTPGGTAVARVVLIIISLMRTAVKIQRGIRSGIINCSYMVQMRSAVRKNLAGNCSKGYFDKGGLDDYTVDENCSKKN